MVIYLDILLIENFIVNLFLITVTMKTIKKNLSFMRYILASIIGTIYIIPCLYNSFPYVSSTFAKIFVALIMNFIILGIKNYKDAIKSTAIFISYSLVLAGIIYFISLESTGGRIYKNVLMDFKFKNLFLGIMIICLCTDRILSFLIHKRNICNYIYDIKVIVNDNFTLNFKGFLDTGNHLREPITNLPVVIAEKSIIPREKNIDEIIGTKAYYVPYEVISGKGGMLKGIKVNKVYISNESETYIRDIILAFCDNEVCGSKDYKGLLPIGIME